MPTMEQKLERTKLCVATAKAQGKEDLVMRAILQKPVSWKQLRTWYAELGLNWNEKPSMLSPGLRKHLEWAWNYAVAAAFYEDTTRHNAQWVSDGIPRGEDQTDEQLVREFAQNWGNEDAETIDSEWIPEAEADMKELSELLRPVFAEIRREG